MNHSPEAALAKLGVVELLPGASHGNDDSAESSAVARKLFAASQPPPDTAQPSSIKPLDFAMFDDLGKEARKDWLVDRLLGRAEASSFYGEPGSGKSVLAEDLGLHVAAGREWLGRPVKQGAVLFLALERAQLVKRRAVAFRLNTGLTGLPFAVFKGELDFRDVRTADAVAATAKVLTDNTKSSVVLVILDTVSRALCGGDENSPKDMGSVVRTIGRIVELTGAHMLCVHHSPADGGSRQRGHSSLKGALDTTVHVAKTGAMRAATVTKANDSTEGEALGFTLVSVDIDRDEVGNLTTAPVVVASDGRAVAKPATTRKLSDRQRLALEHLENAIADRGKPPPAALGLPSGVSTISVIEWRDELLRTGVLDEEAPNPREDFKRLRTALQTRHLIAEKDGLIWRIS